MTPSPHPRLRRRLPAGLAAAALLLAVPAALAEEAAVPAKIQAELLAKVASYDRNLPARAADKVRTLVVSKPKDPDSVRTASQFLDALSSQGPIAELPHSEEAHAFQGAAALAEACKSKKVSVVYLSTGFTDEELAAVSQALDDADLLSVSAAASAVRKGVVLGFDLVSGKPKLVVNLTRATRQHVALSANVLRLMAVIP